MAFKRAFFKLFSCLRRKTRKVSLPGADAPSSPTCRLEDSTKTPERRKVSFVVDVELHKVERCDLPRKDTTEKKKKIFFKTKDIRKEENTPRQASCCRRDRWRSQKIWEEVHERMHKTNQPERSILEGLSSIATLFRLKRRGQMAVPEPRNKNLYGLAVLALMEDNHFSSFTAGLAAMLAVYDISKIPPAMDPKVESQLLNIFGSMWMSSVSNRGENIGEEEKKLLEETFGLLLRGLLQQAAKTEHLIFILKHFEKHSWQCFSSAWNQLRCCGTHNSRINLTEAQRAFPHFPVQIAMAGYEDRFINEGDLTIEEL
ncbi:uncharacterized protein LOC120309687 isoform X3 [Crotalus tigris]|uniref:uncharacterized protein LOC120309687 isoform X3 n=1 Tax=Crotalus tigris TaxID=88082 RepID=UPI00192F5572|nr:uncharacterized protein LOC120309687 isoform X3 [Crotalus tigris]